MSISASVVAVASGEDLLVVLSGIICIFSRDGCCCNVCCCVGFSAVAVVVLFVCFF